MMRPLHLQRYALCVGIAASLTGCGRLQSVVLPGSDANAITPSTRNPYYLLYSFKGGENGNGPLGSLLDLNGLLYGATLWGGSTACYGKAYGCGTIFTMTLHGGQHVLYRFKPPGGFFPNGDLIHLGNSLYGLTSDGGSGHCGGLGGCGTAYELSTSGKERTIYSFQGLSDTYVDGESPEGGLRYLGGKFYGVTFDGGSDQNGTIFALTLAGKERILHNFTGGLHDTDGAQPQAGLIDVNGTLYGTTSAGGRFNRACDEAFGNACGTVFSITPSGAYRVLYRFHGGRDAAYPIAGLTYLKGTLYGTSFFGGNVPSGCPAGCGTVFSIDPTTGHEHVMYRFTGAADGNQPAAALLQYKGMLYGTTALGGPGSCSVFGRGCGAIFQITTTGRESTLHSFNANGNPNSRLIEVNGRIFGTTPVGGPYCYATRGCGTFFMLKL